ncbi:MAG: cellulase family glycosylhydrolase [Acidimicrobiia bacterium]
MWGRGTARGLGSSVRVRACALGVVLAVAAGLLVASGPANADPADGLAADGRWWRDASGRVVLLHGVNVVRKVAPYIPSPEEFGPADADRIASLGWNTVRLGFIWAGMQPSPGAVDTAYLDRYEELVNLLGERGIHVLVDSHQDLWNERWGGEGAPDWAVLRPGAAKRPNWALTYFSQASLGMAYWDFWWNRNGILDQYTSMWRQVAERFSANPYVLGYDILNEPWTSPLWFLPQDRLTVQRMYDKVIPAIRAVDAQHTIFWEPSIPSSQFLHDRMTFAPGSGLALSFHVYCAASFIFGRQLWPEDACRSLDDATLRGARSYSDGVGAGWLVTEYGASNLIDGIDDEADIFDREFVGWQYWEWKNWGDPTTHKDARLVEDDTGPVVLRPKVDVLERTYARRIAGVPRHHSFDAATASFRLTYTPNPAISSPTEIWLPLERHYPHGYAVTVAGATWRVASGDAHVLYVTAATGAPEVRVEITPAA